MRVRCNNDRSNYKTVVVLLDGEQLIFDGDQSEEFESVNQSIIPAAPGFEYLSFWFEEEEPNVAEVLDRRNRQPIVGWINKPEGPVAVILDDIFLPNHDQGVRNAILCPSGIVVLPGDKIFSNLNDWAADVCIAWGKWREKQKSKAVA